MDGIVVNTFSTGNSIFLVMIVCVCVFMYVCMYMHIEAKY